MKIFDYCEALPLSIVEQPFNALSSILFILMACLLLSHAKKHSLMHTPHLGFLILIAGIIGIGSFIWHTHLSLGTFALDVIPIFAFLILYQWIWYRDVMQWNARQRIIAIGVMLLAMGVASLLWNDIFVQKSNAFIPLVLWLGWTVFCTRITVPAMIHLNAIASLLLSLAIIFRMSDVMLCDSIPMGTHFLWHGFCAFALYAVTRGYMEGVKAHA